jgi:WipA-like, phosphatase domain
MIMPHDITVQEEVDLTQYPPVDDSHPISEQTSLTIGDLHGNALKFIWFLIHQNVMQLQPVEPYTNPNDVYQRIVDIYKKPAKDLTLEDIKEFNHIIQASHLDNKATIRLIGDELADRGANDYFTLKILEKLGMSGVNTEIILSNHSAEFLDAYGAKSLSRIPSDNRLGEEQARSLYGLSTLFQKGLVSRDEVESIVERHYKPHLKPLSYSINKDSKPAEITLYTHAPVGLETIQQAATALDIEFKDDTMDELIETIDAINDKYYERNIKINDLFSEDKKHPAYDITSGAFGALSINPEMPFLRFAWNRTGMKIATESGTAPEVKVDIPIIHHDYKLNLIHGHEGPGQFIEQENVINLDNNLGKAGRSDHEFNGDYHALVTEKETLSPQRSIELDFDFSNNFYDKVILPINEAYHEVAISEYPNDQAQVALSRIRDIIKTHDWQVKEVLGFSPTSHTIEYQDQGEKIKKKLPNKLFTIYQKTAEGLSQKPEKALEILHEINEIATKAAQPHTGIFKDLRERANDTQRVYDTLSEQSYQQNI